MKTLIFDKHPSYTIVCAHRASESTKAAVYPFMTALKERTGAELSLVSYDENGTPRGIWNAIGWKRATYGRNGSISELYGAEGRRLARYDADGTLTELFCVEELRGKTMAKCRPDGTIERLFDTKGKPLADCDATGAILAIRHPASDLLTEEDEELEERRALAEERLAIAHAMASLERETLVSANAEKELALRNREAGKEIVVGRMAGRPLTDELHATLPPTGYDVRFVGDSLMVSAYADLLLKKAFSALAETVAEESDAWTLEDAYHQSAVGTRVATVLPALRTQEGSLRGVYYCGDENFELCYGGVTTEEFEAYRVELKAMGFVTYDENQIADCLFGTYTIADEMAGEAVVFTMHYPKLSRTQIVYGPRGFLPSTQPAKMPEQPMQTTFTQPGRACVYYGNVGTAINGAPGMSYVAQLADGSYIIIDGGPGDGKVIPKIKRKGVWIDQPETETHDEEDLYKLLCEHAPNGEKPRIAAWLITHPHGDHMGLANRFLQDYAGKVEIALAGFNFPDFDSVFCKNERPLGHKGCAMPFRERITDLYGAETFVMHAGQRIFFPGCEIEILYTQEDYYPCDFHWGNHLSCAFRMKFADKTVMILGDCEKTNCQDIADAYGEELKSDVLQLTHHGFNGACFDINKLVDPDICLWACDGFRFECDARNLGTADGYLFNRYLRDRAIKKREHYHSDTTIVLKV